MKTSLVVISTVLLASCQASKITTDAEANIHHGIIKSGKDQIAEICPELKTGQTLNFQLDASLPILFNLHYHQGKKVAYPIPEKNLTKINQQFTAPVDNTYCLMWKTHLDKTKVKYQYSITQ